MPPKFVWQKLWPVLVLFAAPLIVFAPVIAGRVWYWGVPLLQFYPWQRFAAEAYRAGQLPLWNPLVGNGAPLAANLQTGAFYPLNFLYLILPTEYAMGYTAILHVILAGLFMYAYLRALKLSPVASLIGALAFELNGFLVARAGFLSVTAAVPWLAAWLWRAEKLHEARGKDQGAGTGDRSFVVSHSLWLALAIGLGVLAGHAQTAVYGLAFVSLYFVWRTFTGRPAARSSSLKALGIFALAVLLGLGLAAVQLLPAAELTRESQRAGGLDYTMIMSHSFWPLRLLTLFSPDFFGSPAFDNFWGYDNYWENAAYIGVIPLLLAGYAIWIRIKNRKTPAALPGLIGFFGVAALIALILAFGWFTPIYPFLNQAVPGFNLFQGPARWIIITVLALCVLAGIGLQALTDRAGARHGLSRRTAARLIFFGLALSLAGLAASFVLKGRVETLGPATLRFGALLLLAGLLFHPQISSRKSQIALSVVVVLDLVSAHILLNPTLPPGIYRAENPTAQALKAAGLNGRVFYFATDEDVIKFDRYLAHRPPEGGRVFDGFGPADLTYWQNLRAALLPNAAMIDRLPAANNFDSLLVGRYQQWLNQVETAPWDEAIALLARMNVAYVISPRDLPLPAVTRTPDVTVYRNPQVLPRAWIAPQDVDLAKVGTLLPGSQVESLTDSGNTVTIRAALPETGWLILADTAYPGWQVSIDGQPGAIEVANGAARAVRVPGGAHTIEFRYEPRSVSIGLMISLAALSVIVIGLIVSVWLRRR
jgi:hypothetical protein